MAGEKTSGILDPGLALQSGFTQIANLTHYSCGTSPEKEDENIAFNYYANCRGDDDAGEKTAYGSSPGLIRGNSRGKFFLAQQHADKIGTAVGSPGDKKDRQG